MGGPPVSRRVPALLRRTAVLLAATAAALLQPAPATAQPDGSAPVQTYASCLNGQRAGDLLLLIDESGSLKSTDKGAQRVQAAKYLLTQLANESDRAGITVDVQIAGFATDFDTAAGSWTALTPANLPGLSQAVDGFADRNNGQDTDYWSALEGARRSLADQRTRAGAGEAGRCQAIAWFSDGRLDITQATTARRERDGVITPNVTAAGAQEALCAPQGKADQLRNDHVVMFGVGLAPPGTPENEFDLMRSIVTGAPFAGGPCGAITDPVPGTFTRAEDLDALLFAFDGVLGRPDIPSEPTALCAAADTACRGQEFVLDDSIDGFHILGQADAVPGLTAELVGPDGTRHPLSRKDAMRTNQLPLGPIAGTYSWQTDRTVVIDIDNPGRVQPGWVGVWALRFIDPNASTSSRTARSNIRIWGNIRPRWVDAKPNLPSGSDPAIVLGLEKADRGEVVPGDLKGTFRLTADLIDPTGRTLPVVPRPGLDAATVGRPVTLPLTSIPQGRATLRLSLDLTTAPARRPGTGEEVPGTRLATQTVDVPLTVESPLGFPGVPARVDFGTGPEGATELTARMAVRGPGCVWVPAVPGPALTTRPDGTSGVSVAAEQFTSAQSCLSLADGQGGDVVLHLTTDRPGNGTAGGTLPVVITPPDRPDQARTVNVTFTGDLRTALNPVNFWVTLIVALLLGPGIPIGLLYLVKWVTAKIPARGLYARTIPVRVEGGRTLRDGAPFRFRADDFVQLAEIPPGGTRRLAVDDVVLRTRTGRSPFGAGHVSVEPAAANGLLACLAPDEAKPRGDLLATRLPLSVHGRWVVLHDPTGPAEAARVLVLVAADASARQRERLGDEIAERLPGVLHRLRRVLDESGPDGGTGDVVPAAAATHAPPPHAPAPQFGPRHGTGGGSDGPTAPHAGAPARGPSDGPVWDGRFAGPDDAGSVRHATSPYPVDPGSPAGDADVPQSWPPRPPDPPGPPTYGPRG